LLEQRIGRLDRIGQSEEIRIHVPYFENHGQEVLFHWYHQGMNAFEQTNPAGHEIRLRTQDTLEAALALPGDADTRQRLIEATRTEAARLRELLESGRDRLLELASFDAERAETLKD
ncbi:MAG TPA: RNA polymerase-associated protein RapA, partial [Alcanivorax sp.]|nr:RNA polymerase-associated protein RapA [Alcanivorax sp.]